MRTRPRTWAALLAASALSACAGASAPPAPINWIGGDPTHLAADKAACQKEVEANDVDQANGYSDPRYGVANALAAKIDDDDPLTNHKAAVRAAAFEACMTDKGWHSP